MCCAAEEAGNGLFQTFCSSKFVGNLPGSGVLVWISSGCNPRAVRLLLFCRNPHAAYGSSLHLAFLEYVSIPERAGDPIPKQYLWICFISAVFPDHSKYGSAAWLFILFAAKRE